MLNASRENKLDEFGNIWAFFKRPREWLRKSQD